MISLTNVKGKFEFLSLLINDPLHSSFSFVLAESRCLRKLKYLSLDSMISTKQSISLVSLLEPFSSVKTLSLRRNSYLNKTIAAEGELNVIMVQHNIL